MTEKSESNRRRKWAPKARTGCRTCKTRHVKCDEAKPICRRCVLSGFRCDGYPSIPNKRENSSPPNESSPDSINSDRRSSVSLITTKSEVTPATSIESPPTTASPTPLVVAPVEPYINSERNSLQFFIDITAPMVARSRTAPLFWKILVPRAAWTYPSVRHAMLAASVSSHSLVSGDDTATGRQQSELRMLGHASKAVQSLLRDNAPLDVVLLTSATLGILDLFNGQWDTACTHVTSGAKLAKQARLDKKNDPFISFYCEAFASALPSILAQSQPESTPCPPEKNDIVRLDEAVRSLKLAIASFDHARPRVEKLQSADRDRILSVLNNAKAESEWILYRWEQLLREESLRSSPPDESLQINLHRVESPWSAVMSELNIYLDNGGVMDVAKFEVAMERTLPFYMWAKSGPHRKMRQSAAEMMLLGAQMRGKLAQPSPMSPTKTSATVKHPGGVT